MRRLHLQFDLYAALQNSVYLDGVPISDCPGQVWHGRGSAMAHRIHIGNILELGDYGSISRQHRIDNLQSLLMAELYPWISGIQWLPEPSMRHHRGSCILLFLVPNSISRLPTRFFISMLPCGIFLPSLDFNSVGPVTPLFGSACPPRPPPFDQYAPPTYPTPLPADITASTTFLINMPLELDLPDPACVTVKIRGLLSSLHREGITSIFLQACGYSPSEYTVLLEFYPPMVVHGIPLVNPLLSAPRAWSLPQDVSVVFATVTPPLFDPLFSRAASRTWNLPGHSHPVRLSIIPSVARPVAGCLPYTPSPPLRFHAQRPSPPPASVLGFRPEIFHQIPLPSPVPFPPAPLPPPPLPIISTPSPITFSPSHTRPTAPPPPPPPNLRHPFEDEEHDHMAAGARLAFAHDMATLSLQIGDDNSDNDRDGDEGDVFEYD